MKRYEQERAHVVDALTTLIDDTPGWSFSTRDIADEAGVHQSLLFRYFGGRAGMVEALVERWRPELDEAAAGCESGEMRLLAQLGWIVEHKSRIRFLALEGVRATGDCQILDVLTLMLPDLKEMLSAITERTDDTNAVDNLAAGVIFGLGWILMSQAVEEFICPAPEDLDSFDFVWRYLEVICTHGHDGGSAFADSQTPSVETSNQRHFETSMSG